MSIVKLGYWPSHTLIGCRVVARAPLSTVVPWLYWRYIRYVAIKLFAVVAEVKMKIFLMLQLVSVFGNFWVCCGLKRGLNSAQLFDASSVEYFFCWFSDFI